MDGFKAPELPTLKSKGKSPSVELKQNSLLNTTEPKETPVPVLSPKNEAEDRVRKAKFEAMFSALNYSPPASLAAEKPDDRYFIEVLKGGSILDNIKFPVDHKSSYFIVGRIPGCDIVAEHPTVSRIHAILQFIDSPSDSSLSKNTGDGIEGKGLYLYDLGSSHGTFLNKNRLYPKRYYRIHVGHMIKFGNSTRLYIVNGPSEDEEEESKETVSELKQQRLMKELERKKLEAEGKKLEAEEEESKGISWGMAEDAEEETDLTINPFALDHESSTLELDNPKKSLRSWFDREGADLVYDVQEKSAGHFLCKITLPLENGPLVVDLEHKGKKKEAIHQCALKACQMLDNMGLLRQSNQESFKKRKIRNWENEDYYSSDEDLYLDRTGTIEKKREKRMKIAGKAQEKVETYESLNERLEQLDEEWNLLSANLEKAEKSENKTGSVDPLDEFMSNLKTGVTEISKWKKRKKEIIQERIEITKLMRVLKPAELPGIVKAEVLTPCPVPTQSQLEDKEILTVPRSTSSSTKEIQNCPDNVPTDKDSTTTTTTTPSEKVISSDNTKPGKANAADQEVSTSRDENKKASEISSSPQNMVVKPENKPSSEFQRAEKKTNTMEAKKKILSKLKSKDMTPKTTSKDACDTSSEESEDEDAKNLSKLKSYSKMNDPDYCVWVPPQNQDGDGRTSLNDKFGY